MFSTPLSPCSDLGQAKKACGSQTVEENCREGTGCVLQPPGLPGKFLNAREEDEGRQRCTWGVLGLRGHVKRKAKELSSQMAGDRSRQPCLEKGEFRRKSISLLLDSQSSAKGLLGLDAKC